MEIGDPFLILETHAVAAHAEYLAQDAVASELMRGAGDLLQCERAADVAAEVVDPGHVHELVVRHGRADDAHLADEGVLGQVVAREREAVFLAPFVHAPAEIVAEKAGNRQPEIVSHPIRLGPVEKEQRQFVDEAVPARLFKRIDHGRCPGNAGAPAIVGLVREDAGHKLAEVRAEPVVVCLVRDLQERVRDRGIQQVHVRVAIEPVALRHHTCLEQEDAAGGPGVATPGRVQLLRTGDALVIVQFHGIDGDSGVVVQRVGHLAAPDFLGDQGTRAERWIPGRHQAPGEPARPAIFVVQPRLHVLALPLLQAGSHAVHPFVGQVFGDQACPRVHKVSPEPLFLHVPHLPREFLVGQVVVPRPERRRPILLRRMHKLSLVHYGSPKGLDTFRIPATLRLSDGRGQAGLVILGRPGPVARTRRATG